MTPGTFLRVRVLTLHREYSRCPSCPVKPFGAVPPSRFPLRVGRSYRETRRILDPTGRLRWVEREGCRGDWESVRVGVEE